MGGEVQGKAPERESENQGQGRGESHLGEGEGRMLNKRGSEWVCGS